MTVDREGIAGFDVDLVQAVTDVVNIPVIASGGMGNLSDIRSVVNTGHADAVAMAHVLRMTTYVFRNTRLLHPKDYLFGMLSE